MLCTDTKTFKVREAFHSNSLFAMDASTPKLRLLSNIPIYWETTEVTSNSHDVGSEKLLDDVPHYFGAQEHFPKKADKTTALPPTKNGLSRKRQESIDVVRNRTPLSDGEFVKIWRRHAGVELNSGDGNEPGEAYILSEDVVFEVLKDVLVALKPGIQSISKVSTKDIYAQLTEDDEYEEPIEVVESVIRKFATVSEERKYFSCFYEPTTFGLT